MRYKQKIAAGGVVIRNVNDLYEAILVQHAGHKGWGFPKGHVEAGESLDETALREVEEETGVKADIVEKLLVTHYRFQTGGGTMIDKSVHWYLMRYREEGVQTHAHEIIAAEWVPLDAIERRLTFDNERELFAAALRTMRSR